MMISRNTLLALTFATLLNAADHSAIVPKNGVPPIGPYSAGVSVGDYVYVSGQGAKKPDGQMPASFPDQVRQTLENVKTVLEAAGLSMNNVVYTQVYLEDMANFDAMNQVYAGYFPGTPPARATLGVSKLPGGTHVEINAVAIRDASQKKAVQVSGRTLSEPISAGILTNDRLFISATPADDVDAALDGMNAIVTAAGLKMSNVVFVNPYLTSKVSMQDMNHRYAKRFEFGNTPARATIEVTSLPSNSGIEYTGVAVRDLSRRLAVRPKNMPPSPTASPCVFAGDTLYCSAKSGFVPGPNGGVLTPDVELQVRQTMRNLLDNLEEAGMSFSDVVSTNVYLDDLTDFPTMNKIYAKYFSGVYPARTTVQQIAPGNRNKSSEDTYPDLEQVSLIAVRK